MVGEREPPACACTYDGTARALWIAVEGTAIRIRIRQRAFRHLAAEFTALDGVRVELADIRRMLPPLAKADFQLTSHAYPELRADVGQWCISVLVPQGDCGSRTGGLRVLHQWVSENFAVTR